MNPSDFYVKNIFDKFGYIANWFPNTPINLGDVGIMDGNSFKRLSSLNDLNLEFKTRPAVKSVDFSYSWQADLTIASDVGATVPNASAVGALKIGFNNAGSFVFETANCLISEIENKLSLGEEIKKMFKADMWKAEWVVLDTLVNAGSSTIIVANSKNSELELSASADVSKINLADASLNFKVKSQKGEITKFIGEQGLLPLFKTSKIKLSYLNRLTRNKDGARFGGHSAERTVSEYKESDIWESIPIQ